MIVGFVFCSAAEVVFRLVDAVVFGMISFVVDVVDFVTLVVVSIVKSISFRMLCSDVITFTVCVEFSGVTDVEFLLVVVGSDDFVAAVVLSNGPVGVTFTFIGSDVGVITAGGNDDVGMATEKVNNNNYSEPWDISQVCTVYYTCLFKVLKT